MYLGAIHIVSLGELSLQAFACFLNHSSVFLLIPTFNYNFTSHFGSVLILELQ